MTTREKLEKATADWVAFVGEVNGKDGGPSSEDQEKLARFQTDVNGLIAAVKAQNGADEAQSFVSALAGKAVASSDEKAETIDGIAVPKGGETFGELFVKSPAYKDFLKRYAPNGEIRASAKGIQSLPFTSDLSIKDIVTGASATSGGAFVTPDRYAPVTDLIGELPLTAAALLTQSRTTSDAIEYVRITGKTSNASFVPEASATGGTSGQKPESALTLEVVSTNVLTMAHWMAITKRAASDAPQVQTLVNQFLRTGLAEVLDTEILNGSGTGQHFNGINTAVGSVGSTGTDIDAIVDAIRTIRAQRRDPNAMVIHPNDWYSTNFLLAKTGDGVNAASNYLIGDPRASLDQLNQLWGLRVVVSPSQPENTALVGDFRWAVLWEREGVTVTMTDSHDDFFTRNLLAILAEGRWALGILDLGAFCRVTGV